MKVFKSNQVAWLFFLLLFTTAYSQFYDASFKCKKSDYPEFNRNKEIETALDKLNLHWIDSIIFMGLGPLTIVFSLIVIFTFIKYREMKDQPGDLFLMTALSELALTVHWMVSAGYFLTYPESPPKSNSNFCFYNAIIAVFTGTLEFLYNVGFCLYIYFRLRNILKQKSIPRSIFHIICLGISTITVITFYLSNNFGKSLFGTCSIKAVSNFPIIGPFILVIYIFIAFWTMIYFKKNMPQDAKFESMKRDFFDYYFLYLKSCIFIWSIQVVCTLFGVFNCWFIHVDIINIVLTIGNFSKLLSPVVLSIIRLKDPFLKPKVRKFLRLQTYPKSRTKIIEAKSLTKELNEPLLIQIAENLDFSEVQDEEIDYLTELTANLKTSMIYSMLSGILFNSGIDHNRREEDETKNIDLGKAKDRTKPIGEEFAPKAFTYSPSITLTQKKFEISFPDIAAALKEQGSSSLNLQMRIHAPNVFQEILDHDADFINLKTSLDLLSNGDSVKKASGADGGKSGEFFFFSYDNRVVIKTMTTRELKVLLKMLSSYYKYIATNPSTLIAKIYGLYTFHVESKKSNPIHIIIIKNVSGFPVPCHLRIFDLKGSTVSREVFKNENPNEEKLRKKVMKDLDFLRFESKVKIHDSMKETLLDNLTNDSKFFRSHGIMDYSLIIFKIDIVQYENMKKDLDPKLHFVASKNPLQHLESSEEPGVYYHIGLIDYLQEWTLQKIVEKASKTVVKVKRDLDVSAQDPEKYSERFIEFINKII